MRPRRTIRKRRAISAVVSNLLMVVGAGIIGSYLVVWANSSFATQSGEIVSTAANKINQVRETYVLEDVWFNGTNPTMKGYFTIRNTGDNAIKISHIYVNNTEVWSGSQTIAIDAKATISKDPVSSTIKPGNTQSIWVRTERGTDMKQVWNS